MRPAFFRSFLYGNVYSMLSSIIFLYLPNVHIFHCVRLWWVIICNSACYDRCCFDVQNVPFGLPKRYVWQCETAAFANMFGWDRFSDGVKPCNCKTNSAAANHWDLGLLCAYCEVLFVFFMRTVCGIMPLSGCRCPLLVCKRGCGIGREVPNKPIFWYTVKILPHFFLCLRK